MQEKPLVTTPVRSPLFREIIDNDTELRELKGRSVILFSTASRLRERKRELIRAAEKALSWNTDKGNKV